MSLKVNLVGKNCNHFLKSRCISELFWNSLKKTNAQVLPFFLQSFSCVSDEQPYLKTTGLYGDLLLLSTLFHFFYFIISAPLHMFVFQFLHLFFFFYVLAQVFGLPWWLSGKESTCNVGNEDSIPWLGIFPGEGNGNPLQYSCLENPMDRGAWWATVHGITKNRTRLSN